nr:MAG TPA: hypothetical protein [Caudoviricetes sp.]
MEVAIQARFPGGRTERSGSVKPKIQNSYPFFRLHQPHKHILILILT